MQAILILAHKDIDQVTKLATILNDNFEIYIHFDKKMNVPESYKQILDKNKIHYISKIYVNWGSWSIGAATVLLMKEALKNPQINYMHVISGQDWLTDTPQNIYDRFKNNDKIYMTYFKATEVKKAGEPIIWWQKYYFNYDKINRRSTFGKFYHRGLLLIQTLFRVDKLKKLGIDLEIYSGENWVDMPRDAVEYCINYLDFHPNLLKMLQTGCFSDEFWMQTILCNSPKFRQRIIKNHHRYIKWHKQHESYPAILDMSDFDNIINGDYIFARKFDTKYSKELISNLNNMYKNNG
ncbi:glycosyltransferase [Lactobacillus salivarius]|uniref:beta-1,6-N-acetylglucosaminyltransferase n=1 Tax=Ligilactobacillus salivarius TaxID=1624 RepID=UPI0009DB1DED|nr:beta-1,6-N-acetylglucosaminyltransferase [Ligilactobacillus salivarius]MCR4913333.1 beta-1,6-N-acetylglucosaminyltransferase [Lactobacillus sp.]MBE7386867.1 glycosyltransferase [Ligilactobacillus salivarius]MBE7391264.1 glycosyltransferase [Ligilactobacillus salivarius]MDY2639254.1 beta-1,6-N-acetylglucosaminyltransferase [Ligilactobacillus salivarius]MDY5247476.1 beta-1,6-N-acetylglucosaminyltransferase [Ligilactobacillus salivarius]